jgi:4-amino-4-deoxy-L-arabinose transferase-like glycosyltransferase
MKRSWAESLLQDGRTLWVSAALAAVLFLTTNLPWHLDDYDQAKQAFTSFEMVQEGHWLYQRTPHERVATKPPLVGWFSSGLFAATRSWDIAWRLPSLLAAGAISVLLFRAAASAYGPIAGVCVLSAFSFNLLTPRLATLVRTDMSLAMVIFVIGLTIWRKIVRAESWKTGERWRMFLLLTAGMLIKGPIVYAFLLPAIALFQWWRRKSGAVSAWCGWWPWLASLAVFLIWVVGGTKLVPGFWDQVVMREFVGRFGETIHRPQPFYFYFPHLLHKFAPWSILLVTLAFVRFQPEDVTLRSVWQKISPETFWLIAWSVSGLVIMSVVPSKRVDRIFPVIPPLCLLLGAQIGKISVREHLRARVHGLAAAALGVAVLFAAGYSAFKVFSAYRNHHDALVNFGRDVRAQAAASHWHYEAISGSDEGMLLYLQKPHFIDPGQALEKWNSGDLDALILPGDEEQNYRRILGKTPLVVTRSTPRSDQHDSGYVLIARPK